MLRDCSHSWEQSVQHCAGKAFFHATIRTMLIHRMTTRYVPLEDRICLTGETDTGATVHLWLTQRLLAGLLPPVFRWLEKIGTAPDAGTAQSSASATESGQDPGPAAVSSGGATPASGDTATAPTQPVQEEQTTHEWLVRDVNLSGGKHGVKLVFNPAEPGEGTDPVTLVLETSAARQWMVILHRHFQKAGWSVTQWPAWLRDPDLESPTSVAGSKVLH